MKSLSSSVKLLLLSAASWGAPLCAAHAQVADERVERTGAEGTLEVIVVTAQKRSENVQDVPLSISVFSGDQLADRQIQSMRELVSGVSNLQVNEGFAPGLPVFALRGITALSFGPADPSPVATYYDEVYKGSLVLLGLGLYDIERVEVLKGPQGTLYGRSTTGGAINLVARKPEFRNQANFSAGYGNFNRVMADGAVEGALSDVLGVRVAFTADRDDGVIENRFPGADDVQQTRQYAARSILRYKPSDATDIQFRFSTSRQDSVASAASISIPGPLGIGGPVYQAYGLDIPGDFREGLGERDVNTPDAYRHPMRTNSASVHAGFELSDTLSLTSITSWDEGRVHQLTDTDGVPRVIGFSDQSTKQTQLSQDVRITSDLSGPFNFIVGAYYGRDKTTGGLDVSLFTDIDLNADGTIDAGDCIDSGFFFCQLHTRYQQKRTSVAGYLDSAFKVSDAVTLRGGLRYTRDEGRIYDYFNQIRSADGVPIANAITGGGPDDPTTLKDKFDDNYLSYKLGIDYETSAGTLLYASYNVGYRAAIFNSSGLAASLEGIAASEPEKLSAAEVGFKSELFDGGVRLNGAAFWYDFKDQQLLTTSPTNSNAQFLGNLSESRILGAELDAQVRLSSRLSLSASAGLIDSEVRKGIVNTNVDGVVTPVDVKGNNLVQAPDFTFSAAVDYALPLASWTADFHVDVSHTSSQYFDIFNSSAAFESSYDIVSGRIRFHPDDDRYGIALWAKNLTDEYYRTLRIDNAGFGYIYTFVNAPRTYGISVDAKF